MPTNLSDIDQSAGEWIATTEQLPDTDMMVLFWVSYTCDPVVGTIISEPKLGWYSRSGSELFFETAADRPDRYDLEEVSHWMPLRPPPGKRFV